MLETMPLIALLLAAGVAACRPDSQVAFTLEEVARWTVPVGVDFSNAMILDDDRIIVWSDNGEVLSLSVDRGGRFVNQKLALHPIMHTPRRGVNELEAIIRETGELVYLDAQDNLLRSGKACQLIAKAETLIRTSSMYAAVTPTDRPNQYVLRLVEWNGSHCRVHSDMPLGCRKPYITPLGDDGAIVSCSDIEVPPTIITYEYVADDRTFRELQLSASSALPPEKKYHAFPILLTSEGMVRFVADLASAVRHVQVWENVDALPTSMVIEESMGVVASHPDYDLMFGMQGRSIPEFVLLSWRKVMR